MYKSSPLSFSVWHRLLESIDAQFDKESKELTQSLAPVRANLDTAQVLLDRAQKAREAIPDKVMRLEQLLTLSMQIENQLREDEQKTALQSHAVQLQKLEALINNVLAPLCQQPERLEDEEDLHYAIKQMVAMNNSGNGERISEEKIRLRAIERFVRPFGKEDSHSYVRQHKSLSAVVYGLQAEAISAQHGAVASLQFPVQMQGLLNEFNIPCNLDAAQVDETTQQDADAS